MKGGKVLADCTYPCDFSCRLFVWFYSLVVWMLCLQAAIGRKFAHIFFSFIFLQFQPYLPYTYVLGAYLCTLRRVSIKQRHDLWS